jgi:magnesium transporter
VRARCEREPELLALGPSYTLYAVFDYIVDNFLPIVNAFKEELAELERDIFAHEFQRTTVLRLYELKKELVTLRLAISPMQDILNQLMRFFPNLIREDVRPYFRDVYDHVVRVKEASDTMSEMVNSAMTVNLAMVSVGQNEVVKRLAGWAALLAVPDAGGELVRHELQAHAGARRRIQLLRLDRVHAVRELGPLPLAQTLEVALKKLF